MYIVYVGPIGTVNGILAQPEGIQIFMHIFEWELLFISSHSLRL